MNYRIFLIATALLVLPLRIWGADTTSYTLSQILRQAAESTDDVQKIELAYEEGVQQMRFYRAEAFPMVTFSSGVSYSSQSLKSQLDAMGLGGGGGGFGAASFPPTDNISDPATQAAIESIYGLLAGLGSQFQVEERSEGVAFNWNLNVIQPLITFGKVRSALKAARIRSEMLTDKRRLDYDLYYLRVINAFAEALRAQNEYEIAQQEQERISRLHTSMQINLTRGMINEIDFLRIDALKHRQTALENSAGVTRTAALKRLVLLAGLNDDPASLRLIMLDPSPDFTEPEETSGTSLEARLNDQTEKLMKCNVKYERAKLFPSINLVGGTSNSFVASEDNSLSAKDLFDGDMVSWHIGLSLSWTIFDGFRTPARYHEVQAQTATARIAAKQKREQNKIAIEEALAQLEVSRSNRSAAQLQTRAAKKALAQSQREFDAGRLDMTDLLDAQRRLNEARKMESDSMVYYILAIAQARINLGLPLYGDTQ